MFFGRLRELIDGRVTETDFCSERNPQPDCDPRGPQICRPRNPRTLQIFTELQEQVNRVARVDGFPEIAVDGDIGPETIKGVENALGMSADNCDQIAYGAAGLAEDLKMTADEAGEPDVARRELPDDIDPSDPGDVEAARDELQLQPRQAGFFGLGPVWTVVAAGLGVIALWGVFRADPRQ